MLVAILINAKKVIVCSVNNDNNPIFEDIFDNKYGRHIEDYNIAVVELPTYVVSQKDGSMSYASKITSKKDLNKK